MLTVWSCRENDAVSIGMLVVDTYSEFDLPPAIKHRTFACHSERSEESLTFGVETLRYRSGRHDKAKLSESPEQKNAAILCRVFDSWT
jgi:hypothetical protein